MFDGEGYKERSLMECMFGAGETRRHRLHCRFVRGGNRRSAKERR